MKKKPFTIDFKNIDLDNVRILLGDCFIVGLISNFVSYSVTFLGFSESVYILGISTYLSMIFGLCLCAYWTKQNALLHISLITLTLLIIKFLGDLPYAFQYGSAARLLIVTSSLHMIIALCIAALITKFILKKT